MKIGIVKNNLNNIFAAFSNDTLVFPSKPYKEKFNFNSTLSNPIQNWAQKNININPNIISSKVFLTTYLTKEDKKQRQDLDNILLYNLNSRTGINSILRSVNKIIIQGMDNVKNWLQPEYLHYYFYGFFDNLGYVKYKLYDCNCGTNLFLDICDYLKLFAATRNKRQILNQISQNYLDKLKPKKHIVPLNTKFYLKIKINSNFFPETVDNLKKLIDVIVVFCNKICIIETDKPRVNGNGYNPTDDLLYYCEIEKVDDDNKETKNDIIFCVCPICDKNKDNCCCEEKQDSVKSFPGFREGDGIEFFGE